MEEPKENRGLKFGPFHCSRVFEKALVVVGLLSYELRGLGGEVVGKYPSQEKMRWGSPVVMSLKPSFLS